MLPCCHRLDLTKEQRDEHIRRYAELLTEQRQSAPVVPIESNRADGRGHKPKGVATQIAEETGLSYKTVQRAIDRVSRAEPKSALPDYDVATPVGNWLWDQKREQQRTKAK